MENLCLLRYVRVSWSEMARLSKVSIYSVQLILHVMIPHVMHNVSCIFTCILLQLIRAANIYYYSCIYETNREILCHVPDAR